jgi:hypothetical protein
MQTAEICERASKLAIDEAYQVAPRAGRTPRSLRAREIASRDVAPVTGMALTIGSSPAANASAAAACAIRPRHPATASMSTPYANRYRVSPVFRKNVSNDLLCHSLLRGQEEIVHDRIVSIFHR